MITAQALKAACSKLGTVNIKGKDYVTVSERVKAFRRICPDGSIETEIIQHEGNSVLMQARVYDEGHRLISTGYAHEKEQSSYINKTSYIENCETSAVGRALGFLGIGIDGDIASAQEMYGATAAQEANKIEEKKRERITLAETITLEGLLEGHDGWRTQIRDRYKVKEWAELTVGQYLEAIEAIKTLIEANEKKQKEAKA